MNKKVLIVLGINLYLNSSVSMANSAYIKGFLENGFEVTVIMPECDEADRDYSMDMPSGVNYCVFPRTGPFEKRIAKTVKVSAYKNKHGDILYFFKNMIRKSLSSMKQMIIRRRKDSLYGNYEYYISQIKDKWTGQDCVFDYMVTISSPVASHHIGEEIKSAGLVQCNKWIQLWEDPWYYDLYTEKDPSILDEERRLLSLADFIEYVSPITWHYQKKYFSEYQGKMHWAFLPCCKIVEYENNLEEKQSLLLGYFGEYVSKVRNIKPLIDAVMQNKKYRLIACGNTDINVPECSNIELRGRCSLDKVEELQSKCDILVNLSNLGGGQIPGKVYQYAGTNKPVLFILDGSDEEIEQLMLHFLPYNRFIFCENNVDAILRVLNEFCQDSDTIQNKPVSAFSPYEVVKAILGDCASD